MECVRSNAGAVYALLSSHGLQDVALLVAGRLGHHQRVLDQHLLDSNYKDGSSVSSLFSFRQPIPATTIDSLLIYPQRWLCCDSRPIRSWCTAPCRRCCSTGQRSWSTCSSSGRRSCNWNASRRSSSPPSATATPASFVPFFCIPHLT